MLISPLHQEHFLIQIPQSSSTGFEDREQFLKSLTKKI